MIDFFQKNKLYFFCLSLFVLTGGTLLFFIEKPDGIFFFSERRSVWGDWFFTYATKLGEEPMYVLAGLFFLWKKRVRHALLVALTGLVVMGLSYGLKSFFAIDRPFTFFRKNELSETVNFVEGIDVHVAATSFPSGHSMSAFAFYSLLIFLLPKKNGWVVFFFSLAVIVAVSRVYLVQHFWEDVYAGGLIGCAVALVFYGVERRRTADDGRWTTDD